MRKEQSSITAAGSVLARAVESARPAGERVCKVVAGYGIALGQV